MLRNALLVITNKLGRIVKVLNVILLISFRAIFSPADQIFHGLALTFFNYPLIEEAINLKEFDCVSTAFDKNRRCVLRLWASKRVFSRQKSWL